MEYHIAQIRLMLYPSPSVQKGPPTPLRSSSPYSTAQSLDTQVDLYFPARTPSGLAGTLPTTLTRSPIGLTALKGDLIPLISQQPRSSLFFLLLFLSPLFITLFPTIFRYIDRCRSLFVVFLVIYYLCRFE